MNNTSAVIFVLYGVLAEIPNFRDEKIVTNHPYLEGLFLNFYNKFSEFTQSVLASKLNNKTLAEIKLDLDTDNMVETLAGNGYDIAVAITQPRSQYNVSTAWVKQNIRQAKRIFYLSEDIDEWPIHTLIRAYERLNELYEHVYVVSDSRADILNLAYAYPEVCYQFLLISRIYNKILFLWITV